MIRRVFLIVLDSFGIGELPDAADYGDTGSHTLRSISRSPRFDLRTLPRLGLFHITGSGCRAPETQPVAAYGRLCEQSRGKDTTTGHWELAGIISEQPFPTYPEGFPPEVIEPFEAAVGRGVLCNRPYSGTEVIRDYGEEHLRTGKLIVYTSADSVFQIAAHESIVPPETLYDYCRTARRILQGPHAVGRVIARPFAGEAPDFKRTPRRHDFSLAPPRPTLPDRLTEHGLDTVAVGKIHDIFAGRGFTRSVSTTCNADGMEKTMALAAEEFHGLCFVNLVDFDMLYGHRNDVDGYAAALTMFDRWLSDFLLTLRDDDVLMITADHGCDPATPSTDHSREYVPLLVYGNRIRPTDLHTRRTFADVAATVSDLFGLPDRFDGESFAPLILL